MKLREVLLIEMVTFSTLLLTETPLSFCGVVVRGYINRSES